MNNTNNNSGKSKKIGAIWSRTSKAGNEMLSVQVELNGNKYNLVGFRNDYKTDDKHPDFVLQLAEKQPNQTPVVQPTAKKTADQVENQKRSIKPKATPLQASQEQDQDSEIENSTGLF